MIKVTDMEHGWLTLHINNESFYVSYLTDFKKAMDMVLKLSDGDQEVNRMLFDGEGLDLYLTAWRYYEKLFIVWEVDDDEFKPEIMIFDYEEFMGDYRVMLEGIADNYRKDFLLEEDNEDILTNI